MTQVSEYLAQLKSEFEEALKVEFGHWSCWPPRLQDACRYALSTGGKRIRPVLALMTAEAVGSTRKQALPWAMAVELIHTYSLIHDDLPSMDDDDVRRGQPTVHRAYDEAIAILAGDALLTRAFGVLSDSGYTGLTGLLALASGGGGMVGGQVLDLGGELNTVSLLEAMQRLKTGALIRAAAVGGVMSVEGTAQQIESANQYGSALGLLFQITDDLLDREQDAERGGNNVLHHLADDEVLAWRDRVADEGRDAAAQFGDGGVRLVQLVDAIAQRTV